MPKNQPAPAITLAPDGVKHLADGIYIGLSADRYHADEALGSSNIRDILKGANLYWHKSAMNPFRRRKEKKTPAKILGTATHRLLLDGREFFQAEYVRGPYDDDDDEDLSPAEKSALTKAAKKELMEDQELLKREDYDFVLGCKQVLDADEELKGCLDNGLSEVSVFWTRKDGVRCKARLDKLKIKGIGDIKTIANERERPLEDACLIDIANYRYDIPAEHYMEGRRQMRALFDDGKVFIEVSDVAGEREILKLERKSLAKDAADMASDTLNFIGNCAMQKTFAFQIVFIPKKGAPDAWSTVLSPGNPILDSARRDIEIAIERFKEAKAKYGTSRWLPGHAVEELDISRLGFNFGRLPTGAR